MQGPIHPFRRQDAEPNLAEITIVADAEIAFHQPPTTFGPRKCPVSHCSTASGLWLSEMEAISAL